MILPGYIIPSIWYRIPSFQWIAKSINSSARQLVNSWSISAMLATVHPTSYHQPSCWMGDKLWGPVRGSRNGRVTRGFYSTSSALNSSNPNHSMTRRHSLIHASNCIYLSNIYLEDSSRINYPFLTRVSIAFFQSDYIFPKFFLPFACSQLSVE